MTKTVIVDIDGTIALREGEDARGPFDYDRVAEDTPNLPVIAVVEALAAAGYQIVFLSGREAVDACYTDTLIWLDTHLDLDHIELYMRAYEDHRQDAIIKRELYDAHLADRDILCVIDDRDQVVRMWRQDLGLTCMQVAYGDF